MKRLILLLFLLTALPAWATEDPVLVRDNNGVDERETINWVDEDTTTSIATPIFMLESIATQNNPTSDSFEALIRDPVTKKVLVTPLDEMPGGGGGGGDHGGLTGLGDDDHPQYVLRTDDVEDLTTDAAVGQGIVGVGGSAFALTDIATQAELNTHESSATAHHAAPSATAPIAVTGYAFSGDIDAMTEDDAPGAGSFMWVDRASDGAPRKLALSDLAQYAVGGVGGAGNFRGARAYSLLNQSIPNNTVTALTLEAEAYDTDSFHSTVTNTHRMTAPATGYYLVTAQIFWAANSTGTRTLDLRVGGTTTIARTRSDSNNAGRAQTLATVAQFTSGEWVGAYAFQDSGGALGSTTIGNWAPHLTMTLLPDGHDAVVLVQDGHEYVVQSGQTLTLDYVNMNEDIDGHILPFDLSGTPGSDLSNLPDSGVTGGGAGPAWNNPDRVTADDTSRAVVTGAIVGTPSEALIATDFDLAIPDGALIKGILVNIDGAVQEVSNTGSADYEVYLYYNGEVIGDNKASATVWSANGVDAARLYGGSTDTWGAVLSEDMLNSTLFGVYVKVGGSTSHDYQIDAITLNAYYEASGGEYVVAVDSAGILRMGPGTVASADDIPGLSIGLDGGVVVGGVPENMTLAGTSTSPRFGVHDDGTAEIAGVLKKAHATAGLGPVLAFARALGTLASPTVVANGSNLGSIPFWGWDGTDWAAGAEISADVSATPGSNDMPTTLNFKTSSDGGQTPVTRLAVSESAVNALVGLAESGNSVPNATDTLDFFAQTSMADPGEDRFVFWDDSDTQYENLDMTALSEDTTPHADSLLAIQQPGGTVLQASKLSDLITAAAPSPYTIGGLTAGTEVVPSTDSIGMYDSSATDDRKVIVDEFTKDVFPKVAANRTTNQSISQNTATAIQFTTTEWEDYSTMHDSSSNTTRLVAPLDGIYHVTFYALFSSTSTSTTFGIWIDPSNTATNYGGDVPDIFSTLSARLSTTSADISLAAGDYVEGVVFQNATASINAQGRMSMHRVGDIP